MSESAEPQQEREESLPFGLLGLTIGVLGGFTLPICHWAVPAALYAVTVVFLGIGLIRLRKELRHDVVE